MNSAGMRAVRARIARLVVTLVCVGPGCSDGSGLGCDEVEGGAVELSWSLEGPDGQRIDRCDEVRIAQISLQWNEGGEGNSEAWPCEDRSAVTNFIVPAGETRLWVEPVCETDFRLLQRTFEAPAPVVRRIDKAELVTLNAVLITVQNVCPPDVGCQCICADAIDRCGDVEPFPVDRDRDRPSSERALRGSDPHGILANPGPSVF
jgi:hypothetical protein